VAEQADEQQHAEGVHVDRHGRHGWTVNLVRGRGVPRSCASTSRRPVSAGNGSVRKRSTRSDGPEGTATSFKASGGRAWTIETSSTSLRLTLASSTPSAWSDSSRTTPSPAGAMARSVATPGTSASGASRSSGGANTGSTSSGRS
jgi:hypothetical protein